ncbi:MAG TPA: hypothetical protein VGD67_20230 [Pseudonocardiaceae bacterium]
MTEREIDRTTAESEAQDADFAGEHDRPSLADELIDRPGAGDDESVPDDRGGPGGMDLDDDLSDDIRPLA